MGSEAARVQALAGFNGIPVQCERQNVASDDGGGRHEQGCLVRRAFIFVFRPPPPPPLLVAFCMHLNDNGTHCSVDR
ncbi:uncharacterized protein V6R79_010932 [Siganus canaliculatus]